MSLKENNATNNKWQRLTAVYVVQGQQAVLPSIPGVRHQLQAPRIGGQGLHPIWQCTRDECAPDLHHVSQQLQELQHPL
eukprot:1161960-Pelagomonas_calceolata.AAC.10